MTSISIGKLGVAMRDWFKAAVLTAAAWLLLPTPGTAEELRSVTYALPSKSLAASPPRIADQLGLFAKHGIRPTFTYVDSTAQTATALLSRSVDFALTQTAEVIAAEAKGQHLAIVANHYNGLAGSLVLSKTTADRLGVSPDAPVAERLKALNNVLLASVSKISSFTIAYKAAANSVGAEPRFTYMAVNAMGAALDTGAVEGIIVTAPFWTYPVLKGTGVLWISPPKGDLPARFMPSTPSATATTRDFVEANPKIVNDVAAVFDDLSAAVAARPAEVKAAIAKLYPEFDARTLDLIFSMEAKAFNTTPLTPADIQHDVEFMKASGMDFGPIDRIDYAAVLLKR
jgi:ABC-type nitrate/sulfonate/bicarbonate transport system substrate-binding protein